MKRYIRSSSGNEYSYPEIYGYLLNSTMTDIDIMFCSFDKQHLLDCKKTIYRLLCVDHSEDGEVDDYCAENNIAITMTENDTLWEVRLDSWDDDYEEAVAAGLKDGDYLAEINGTQYMVVVVDKDSSRF